MSEVRIDIEAIDRASQVIEGISEKATSAVKAVDDANEKVEASTTQVLKGFNALATSAFSLYNAIDNVQNAQLAADRANYIVATSLEAVEAAQKQYNEAVEKYGADSEQARDAADKLALAQEKYRLATERADQAQQNVSKSMMSAALSVIPSLITILTNLQTVTQAVDMVHKALNATMAANPVMLVVTAIGALVAILVTAYETCEPFRNAVNAIGSALLGFFKPAIDAVAGAIDFLMKAFDAAGKAIQWVWDHTIGPIVNAVQGAINLITGAAGAATRAAAPAGPAYGPYPVPGMQAGGIVTKPTLALLGERGPEAVIPLERMPAQQTIIFEKGSIVVSGILNSELVDDLSEKIARKIFRRGY